VTSFGFNLLKMKFLLDQFVIKREFIKETDQWSLKRLKWYEGNNVSYVNSFEEENELNKEVLMLEDSYSVDT